MKFPYFTGNRNQPISQSDLSKLPPSRFSDETNPEHYTTDSALANAANVAILLGKPLLLTGEPGTGKTQFAARLAWELGQMPLFKFETKSTSKSTDLFYFFNMVGYFQSAQAGNKIDAKEFITYNALGEAILRTLTPNEYTNVVSSSFIPHEPQRSIVLIDEIDKAPRDFPNDILNELEGLYFKISELGNTKISVNQNLAPLVIITSNSERNLPETFLRRCIFHHIEFPIESEKIQTIVERRLQASMPEKSVFDKMLTLFIDLRKHPSISKKPTIGELLLWVQAVHKLKGDNQSIELKNDLITNTIGILLKSKNDIDLAKPTIEKWLQQ